MSCTGHNEKVKISFIMPQKHKPMLLEQLAVNAVGEWIELVGDGIAEHVYNASQHDLTCGQIFLQRAVDLIRNTIHASIHCYLSDKTAEEILKSVNELIDETKAAYDSYKPKAKFTNRMRVIVTLTEVAMLPNLKKINVSGWPKIMGHVISKNFCRLEGLEYLNLDCESAGWDTSETEKYMVAGLKYMTNLKCVCLCSVCTNTIINVLGNNCLALEELDITGSISVNDHALPSLFNCKKIKEVILFGTSVTLTGYRDLLLGLPNIQNLERCDEFGSVLEMLHEQKSSPLSLVAVRCVDISYEQLKLLTKYCPNLVSVSLLHFETVPDLIILKELHYIKNLSLHNRDFYTNLVKQLLEYIGKHLYILHLDEVGEIDMNALYYISQFCPNLKILMLWNCDISDHISIQFDIKRLGVPPFACLERLICVSDFLVHHLEFLIQYSKNIKYIRLGISTDITDETISRVLALNPMKSLEELRILDSSDLTMSTVQLLMTHCDQLCELSDLGTWGGISETELQEFKEYIRSNNININLVSFPNM